MHTNTWSKNDLKKKEMDGEDYIWALSYINT